jgi:hypothetical protein
VVVALAVCAAFAWPKWGAPRAQQARYLYRQRQCLTWALPPEHVVYDDDPTAAAQLLAGGADFRPPARPLFDTDDNRPPGGWGPPAYYRPRALDEMLGNPALIFGFDGVVFMHRRAAASGRERLVVVKIGSTAVSVDGAHYVGCSPEVFEPASWKVGSVVNRKFPAHLPREFQVFLPVLAGQHLRFFAGQPDPADSACFTVQFDLDGKPGTIEGRLADDDGVTLVVRNRGSGIIRPF